MNYNLGRILPVFRGSYEVGTTYDKLDLVYVEGYGTYVAKTTVSSVQPQLNPDVWQIVSKDITSQEVEELFEANEETRNELVQSMINSASSTIQSAITTLTNSVNSAIDDMNDTVDAKMDEADAKLSSFQNTGNALITSQTNTFNAAEEQREETLETAISTMQTGDTTFKNTLQSGVNTWLNEREVEFNESQDERDNEFDSQMNSQLNQFTTAQTQRANTFTENETERANTFTASEAERAEIFEETEAAREEATAAIVEEHEKLLELDNKKANKDGYYEEMTVGLAGNLISPDGVVNNEPYIYRTTAGSTSVSNGNAEIRQIKGNSIVWNQLLNDVWSFSTRLGITATRNGHKTHIEGTATSLYSYTLYNKISGKANHKYMLGITGFKGGNWGTFAVYTNDQDLPFQVYNKADIKTCLADKTYNLTFTVWANKSIDITIYDPILFDLTQMFGAGNEPATVEEFEKLFPNDYYEYNSGEIISTNINSLKSVEFNQYNHTTRKADVFKGNQYQITGTYTAITYSDSTAITPDSNGLFTPTKNDTLTITGGNNTNTCVHLTWSGYRNGDYELYNSHTISIPISSIKDANDNVLFPDGLCSAGSVYDEITSTKAIKRIGKYIITGNESWQMVSQSYIKSDATNMFLYFYPSSNNFKIGTKNILNERLGFSNYGIWQYVGYPNTITTNGVSSVAGTQVHCNIANSLLGITDYTQETIETATQKFKTYLQNQYNNGTPLVIYYELATPIEVDFATTPQDFGTTLKLTYKEDDFGTEEFIKETGKETAPVKASTFYMINLRDKIRNIDGSTDAAALMMPSLDELLTTLGTALNGTLTKSWDSTNNKWEFTFTSNTPEEEGGDE